MLHLYISLIIFSEPFSIKDFPILFPLNFIKLFAIAPTIIKLSIFFIKEVISPILVEILEPPIIQVVGFFCYFKIILIERISFINNGPA